VSQRPRHHHVDDDDAFDIFRIYGRAGPAERNNVHDITMSTTTSSMWTSASSVFPSSVS